MDTISHLLRLAHVDAGLDKRCFLAPATRMDVVYEQRVAPFHVLLEGECDLHVGGTSLHLRAGDVVVIPSAAHHHVTTAGSGALQGTRESRGDSFTTTRSETGDGVIDLFCGHFTFAPGAGTMLFRSLPDPVRVSFGQSPEADAAVRALSALMRAEAEREGAGTAAIMAALCNVLLAMVLRATSADAGPVLWTAVSDQRIASLIDRIVAEPGADWSIDRMSRLAAMSRATLIRRFGQSTGSTIGAFLARIRLMTASELLLAGDETVAAIAQRVGYRSESAFGRAFREGMGTTPATFRRGGPGMLATRP